MFQTIFRLVNSIRPRSLLYQYVLMSIIVALSEIGVLFAIALVVGDAFGDGKQGFLSGNYSKFEEYHNISFILIFLFLVISKVYSLWILKKITQNSDADITLSKLRQYLSPEFDHLRGNGQQEFLAKSLTLPEDVVNSILMSTLQIIPILVIFTIIFFGLILSFGGKMLLLLTVTTMFAYLIYSVTKSWISNATKKYLDKRVVFLGALTQLWTALPSIVVNKNYDSIMAYLQTVVDEKSSKIATLRAIKLLPKLIYDKFILLLIISGCILAGKFQWDLVYFAYIVLIIQRLTPQISAIVNIFSNYQSGMAVLRRFDDESDKFSYDYRASMFDTEIVISEDQENRKKIKKQKLLSIRGVSQKFSGELVFEDINLSPFEADFVAISGPSGCGKTSLLEIIAGIKKPHSGEVLIEDKEIRFAYVPQFPGLFNLSIEVLAELWLNKQKSEKLTLNERERLKRLLDSVGLSTEGLNFETIIGDDSRKLSGGQIMRLTICLSLLGKPDILILDEPTASLDKKSTIKFLSLLERERNIEGLTIIASSHDPLVLKQSSRILELAKIS